ncbi:MAG TPA: ribonuclease HII [Candidatus Limihabitans stercoravium]|nr:ribonuclease HII [Candidatus Limihabitans stercoravium]
MLDYEIQMQQKGHTLIGGVDEAGRGPLAGPVVVAGVVMPLDDLIEGVNDSKKLSEKKREKLYDEIVKKAISWHVAIVDAERIDEINILNATKEGMLQCVENLGASCVLIDAVKLDSRVETVSIIKGDQLSYNIAAASIIAKVTRDRLMKQYALEYPKYQFEKHKGYGTALHVSLLKEYGPCPLHRRTFIKNFF